MSIHIPATSHTRSRDESEKKKKKEEEEKERIVPRKKMQQWRVLGLINSGACFGVLAVNKR